MNEAKCLQPKSINIESIPEELCGLLSRAGTVSNCLRDLNDKLFGCEPRSETCDEARSTEGTIPKVHSLIGELSDTIQDIQELVNKIT